jgi:hypothetical protein
LGKKTPAPPPPPDPYVTAGAQTQQNLATAIANANLSRINQYTPYGSIEYDIEGYNADGTPRYSQTQKLSPAQQELLDSQNQQDRQINSIAGGYMDRIGATMDQPFDMSGAPALRGAAGDAGAIATSFGSGSRPLFTFGDAGPVRSSIGDAGSINGQIGPVGGVQRSIGGYGDVQAGLDFSGAPRLPGVDDFSADRLRVEEALMARQNDGFSRQESDLRTQLANQGVTAGSEAWNREMDALNRSRVDARTQATLAGGQEQSRLFGLGLTARQQDVGERTTAGTFANNAQAQRYAQALGAGGFANSAQAQEYAQASDRARFGNEAQGQRFGQMATEAGFDRDSQAQRFAQELARAGFSNEAQAQEFSQAGATADFGNRAQQQRYAQLLSDANLSNTARQQSMQEQAYLRGLPLNEFNALRSASQITQPSFSGVEPVAMAGTDIASIIGQNYASQVDAYNAQAANSGSFTKGLFGLAGSLGAAYLGRPKT